MGRCVVVVRDYLLDFPSVEVEERRGLTTKRGTLQKNRLLVKDPEMRFTMKQILDHPWILEKGNDEV